MIKINMSPHIAWCNLQFLYGVRGMSCTICVARLIKPFEKALGCTFPEGWIGVPNSKKLNARDCNVKMTEHQAEQYLELLLAVGKVGHTAAVTCTIDAIHEALGVNIPYG